MKIIKMMKVVMRRNWLERTFKSRCLDQRIKLPYLEKLTWRIKTTFWTYKKYATHRKKRHTKRKCTKLDPVSTTPSQFLCTYIPLEYATQKMRYTKKRDIGNWSSGPPRKIFFLGSSPWVISYRLSYNSS
jgi:hypothetical protein